MPTHVRIKSSPIPSIALCEQIETVYKKRIGKYLAKATMDEMKQIDKALAVKYRTWWKYEDVRLRERVGGGVQRAGSDRRKKRCRSWKQRNQFRSRYRKAFLTKRERIKELEKDLIRAEAERDVS